MPGSCRSFHNSKCDQVVAMSVDQADACLLLAQEHASQLILTSRLWKIIVCELLQCQPCKRVWSRCGQQDIPPVLDLLGWSPSRSYHCVCHISSHFQSQGEPSSHCNPVCVCWYGSLYCIIVYPAYHAQDCTLLCSNANTAYQVLTPRNCTFPKCN